MGLGWILDEFCNFLVWILGDSGWIEQCCGLFAHKCITHRAYVMPLGCAFEVIFNMRFGAFFIISVRYSYTLQCYKPWGCLGVRYFLLFGLFF